MALPEFCKLCQHLPADHVPDHQCRGRVLGERCWCTGYVVDTYYAYPLELVIVDALAELEAR